MAKKPLFINPLTDFGAKKILLSESSLVYLIDFVNALLALKEPIVSLTISSPEQLGHLPKDRKAILDFTGITSANQYITIEIQVAEQAFFIDRTLYYSTFPIQLQAKRGEWDFELHPVYSISILAFRLPGSDKNGVPVHIVQLKDQDNRVFYEKLHYIYIEMPNFDVPENALTNRLDEWLYLLKNMDTMSSVPQRFQNDSLLMDVLNKAKIANLSREELASYELSLKAQRDYKNTIDFAKAQGEKSVRKELEAALLRERAERGEKEAARSAINKAIIELHQQGQSVEELAQLFGKGITQIQEILGK